jgi:hypothetical protein
MARNLQEHFEFKNLIAREILQIFPDALTSFQNRFQMARNRPSLSNSKNDMPKEILQELLATLTPFTKVVRQFYVVLGARKRLTIVG